MISSITLLSLLATSAIAQSTVQNIFFAAPSNNDAYVGSVVNVASGLTTYAVACTSGTYSCYTGTSVSSPLNPILATLTETPQVTITEGTSTFDLKTITVIAGETASLQETCTIAGSTSATCVAAVSASLSGISTAITTTTTLGTADFTYHPVTITAGVSKLGGSTATIASGNVAPMITGMGLAGAAMVGLAALL